MRNPMPFNMFNVEPSPLIEIGLSRTITLEVNPLKEPLKIKSSNGTVSNNIPFSSK